jgi:hypothetical protein
MRKITKHVCGAFLERKAVRADNTETDGNELRLFGNTIARWVDGQIQVCPEPGYPFSATTGERLHALAILVESSLGFGQRNRIPWVYKNHEVHEAIEWNTWYWLTGPNEGERA